MFEVFCAGRAIFCLTGGKRVIVQGLGNVGYHAAKFLSEDDGCSIVGVIERDGEPSGRTMD
ncbi:MAG: hypothetical protein KJ622_02275 [Alphaproteobacteria bacterium]|nr:hypothetical protein [Alphaproteobacteria bacterium]